MSTTTQGLEELNKPEANSPSLSPDLESNVARARKGHKWLRLLCHVLLASLLIQLLSHLLVGRGGQNHRALSLTEIADQVWAYSAFVRQPIRNKGLSAKELEALYLSVPNEQSALEASRAYSSRPHLAGSEEDHELALAVLKLFQEELNVRKDRNLPIFPAGSCESNQVIEDLALNSMKPSAWVHVYYPVMNTPLERSLQILDEHGDVAWDADLAEDGDPADPEAAKYRDHVPAFHGYSADGDVQGQLIYADYGRYEDFQELLSRGANLTGKIVLTRSGQIFRGLKVQRAQELGAAGVLIYPDPRDAGFATEENGYLPYPHGPARNPTCVERGSVQFLSTYPGDPTTPGFPSYEHSNRTEGKNIPRIPSLPISWINAQRLLVEIAPGEARKLTGQVSKRAIRLQNHVDYKVTPIWNTVGVIPGHIKNETIIMGGHRDAWVMGAADPVSSHATLHEIVRGFGRLIKSGWKPLRSILMISWDAEEFGIVGSTEWAEDFEHWITNNVVAYINLDGSAGGSQWQPSASPSLAHLIRSSAQEITLPTKPGKTLWDARNDVGPYTNGQVDSDFMALYTLAQRRHPDTEIGSLGSGSDFTPFLQRLGVPSMMESFGPSAYDAAYHYHSIYDSQRWMEIYGDPGFYNHVTIAKHIGVMALRLADSLILPLNTTQYAVQLDDYLDQTEAVASSLSHLIDFSPLRDAIARVRIASSRLDIEKQQAEEEFLKRRDKLPTPCDDDDTGTWCKIREVMTLIMYPLSEFYRAAARVQRVNARLAAFEKGFISEDGIKDREWYRHLGIAPGKWLGYGATPFPSIHDALVWHKNATEASLEVERVTRMLHSLAVTLTP